MTDISRLLSEKFPEEMKDQLPRKTVWNLMFCIGIAAVVSLFAAIYILKQVIKIKFKLGKNISQKKLFIVENGPLKYD